MHQIIPFEHEKQNIRYELIETRFGTLSVAATDIGLCDIQFVVSDKDPIRALREKYPLQHIHQGIGNLREDVLKHFSEERKALPPLILHISGSDFQLQVWEALLSIPFGRCVSYADIAKAIQKPQASRAVGSAVGKNPIAFIIPCHRVVRSSGALGGYLWGLPLKRKILAWEAARQCPG